MNIYFILFFEFFKTGLFAVGGGLATLPFLYDMADKYSWFPVEKMSDLVAVAESTPGPIGVNAATYAGYVAAGVPGSIIATFGLVLPSFIIILIIAKALTGFKDNPYVISLFNGLRPVVVALISVALIQMLSTALFSVGAGQTLTAAAALDMIKIKVVVLMAAIFVLNRIVMKRRAADWHPIVYIGIAAAAGILFKM